MRPRTRGTRIGEQGRAAQRGGCRDRHSSAPAGVGPTLAYGRIQEALAGSFDRTMEQQMAFERTAFRSRH